MQGIHVLCIHNILSNVAHVNFMNSGAFPNVPRNAYTRASAFVCHLGNAKVDFTLYTLAEAPDVLCTRYGSLLQPNLISNAKAPEKCWSRASIFFFLSFFFFYCMIENCNFQFTRAFDLSFYVWFGWQLGRISILKLVKERREMENWPWIDLLRENFSEFLVASLSTYIYLDERVTAWKICFHWVYRDRYAIWII